MKNSRVLLVRRDLLKGLTLGMGSLILPSLRPLRVGAQGRVHEVKVGNNYTRGQWFFDPLALYIQRGDTVRWLGNKWGATVTAFHPDNYNHELRIPENAEPFDSGLMGEKSKKFNTFEWTFRVPGTYDYFSRNHEVLGMIGRIVVSSPGGPAEENAPGYGAKQGRAPVFAAQAKLLGALPSAEIVSKGNIPFLRDVVQRSFPYGDLR